MDLVDSPDVEALEEVVPERSHLLGEDPVGELADGHVDDDGGQHDDGPEGDGAGLAGLALGCRGGEGLLTARDLATSGADDYSTHGQGVEGN